jgi:hypothetical protein
MILPSSRWKESTVRSPSLPRKNAMRSSTSLRAATTASWVSSTASKGPSAR